jgi:predicted aldo/keto reductase-like oxidoreductase
MKKQDRRKFIKNSLLGITGATVIPRSFKDQEQGAAAHQMERKLVFRTLGRTGISLPVISMGAGDTDNPNLVRAAMDEGIVLYATSEYYGNGKNEEMIGKIVKERKDGSVLVMTSVNPAGIDHQAGLFTSESDPVRFMKQFENSLKRLDMDPVDIFLLPFVARRESVYFEPLLKAMEKIKKDGKARFIGIATHSYEHEAIRAAADTGIYDVVMTAYNFRSQNLSAINESIDYATEKGVGIIAMKTMAGTFWDQEKKEAINPVAALKWILQNENIHTTVPGFTTFDQLQADLSVMENLQMSEQEKSDLKLASIKYPAGLFCSQCHECIPQCVAGMDIPSAMRAYMYAYGHRNLLHAWQTLSVAGLPENPCTGCQSCSVVCKSGFDVRRKILDIARIQCIPRDFLSV